MHIICIGLNHTTAPIEVRECLAFAPSSLLAAVARFGCGHCEGRPAGTTEGVILSTCNRLEVYVLGSQVERARAGILQFLGEAHQLPVQEFADLLYTYVDELAARHLMCVAAGLDSMVLGESEILGQVVSAYEMAMAQGAAGTVLSALFRAAIHAGKRARAETAIGCNPASVSSVAVGLAAEVFGGLDGCQVLIIGAGKMGELTAKALLDRGAHGVLVANRTYHRALQLAEHWGGQALTFERLAEALICADIVISSTAAPHTILTRTDVEAAVSARDGRPLFLIDIAVPRDVDPTVGQLSGVHLYDIDDLQGLVEGNLRERRVEVPQVEAIVEDELGTFMDWFCTLDVVPTIAELRHRADVIRHAELERTLRRLGDIPEREQRLITTFSRTLVNKLLHHPTVRLKAEAQNGNGPLYASVVRDLFALE